MDSSLGAWLRKIMLGTAAGVLTGVLAGIGARVAMRIVVLNSSQLEQFTVDGTGVILFTAVVLGAIAGALYGALLPILNRTGVWRGLVFGLGVALVVFGPFVLAPPEGEGLIGPEWLGKALFFALPIVSGVVLAKVVDVLRTITPYLRSES